MSCTFKLAIQTGDLFIPSLGTSHYLCMGGGGGGGGGILFSSTSCYFLGCAHPHPPKHTLTKKKTAAKILVKTKAVLLCRLEIPLKDLK